MNSITKLTDAKPVPTIRDMFALQKFVASQEQYDFNQHLKHTFSEGAYARELLLPAGLTIIGKVHRHGHLNIVSKGLALVWTTEGEKIIDARKHPVTFVSEPGTKRYVYAYEDTVWTTIHLTNETDLAKIEAEIIIPESDFQQVIDSVPDVVFALEQHEAKELQ